VYTEGHKVGDHFDIHRSQGYGYSKDRREISPYKGYHPNMTYLTSEFRITEINDDHYVVTVLGDGSFTISKTLLDKFDSVETQKQEKQDEADAKHAKSDELIDKIKASYSIGDSLVAKHDLTKEKLQYNPITIKKAFFGDEKLWVKEGRKKRIKDFSSNGVLFVGHGDYINAADVDEFFELNLSLNESTDSEFDISKGDTAIFIYDKNDLDNYRKYNFDHADLRSGSNSLSHYDEKEATIRGGTYRDGESIEDHYTIDFKDGVELAGVHTSKLKNIVKNQ